MRTGWSIVAFALLSSCAIWVLSRDLLPAPLYRSMAGNVRLPIARDHPVSLDLAVSQPPTGLLLPVALPDRRGALRVRVTELPVGREIARATITASTLVAPNLARVRFPPSASRLRLEFSSDDALAGAPVLLSSRLMPGTNAIGRLDGRDVGPNGPLLLLEYAWPSRQALWIWLLVIPLAVRAVRREQAFPSLLLALGVAALITSTLLWERDYSRHFGHWDADDYGLYGAMLARWLVHADAREVARQWIATYHHAQHPLGPALLAVPQALGLPVHLAYLELSSLCSFLALILLFGILRRQLGLSYAASALMVGVYGCDLVFLRAFARPVTDALGHLLTMVMLALLLARFAPPTMAQRSALGLVGVLNPLARPQGLAYLPFTALAALAVEHGRAGEQALRGRARTLLEVAVAPLGIVAALFLAFGWWDNFQAALKDAERFRPWYTLRDFSACLASLVQGLPLVWLVGWRRLGAPRARVLWLWAAYYLAVLAVVKAPFWMRHFLPALPAFAALTGLALEETRGRVRVAAVALVIFLAAANVSAVLWQIYDPTNLSLELSWSSMTLG
jgi:hypothetical protein